MERSQYRVWDNKENKMWQNIYIPKKPNQSEYIKELLLTMSGELYLRTVENGLEICQHESTLEPGRFIVNTKLTERDCNQKRYYINDVVKITQSQEDDDPSEWYYHDPIYAILRFINGKLVFEMAQNELFTDAFIDATLDRLNGAERMGSLYENGQLVNYKHEWVDKSDLET